MLVEGAVKLDPLARSLPADQHAVFFPSFSAAVTLADEMSRQATPFGRLILARSEDELVKDRYETQLCLPLSTVARVIGPKMVASIVLTGSDPSLHGLARFAGELRPLWPRSTSTSTSANAIRSMMTTKRRSSFSATPRSVAGVDRRIAASRRLRDAAVMSEPEAEFLDDLVNGKALVVTDILPPAGQTSRVCQTSSCNFTGWCPG